MLSYVFIFAAVAVLGAHASYYCPPQLQRGGHLRSFRNYCFSFHPEHEREFETAEDFCRQDGGHLASIRDIETQNFLYHTMHDQLSYGGEVWIGLNDKDFEDTFVWTDGSPTSFTYWASGQPDNFLGIGDDLEDCVFMDMSEHGKWHDNVCHEILLIHHSKTFICQYPAKILTTTSTTTTTTPRPTSGQTTTSTTQPPPKTTRAATTTTTTTTATTAKASPATTAKASPATTAKASTTTTAKTTRAPTTKASTTTTAKTTRAPTTKASTAAAATTRRTTVTTTPAEEGCPPFECNLDCGLSGYKFEDNGCLICQCDD